MTFDPCTHLREVTYRFSVFLRVLIVLRKSACCLREGIIYLMYFQRPFLTYYGVRCLLWEG